MTKFVLLAIGGWSISGLLIYSKLLNKKITWKKYIKFCILNTFYGILFIILLFLFGTIIGMIQSVYPLYLLYIVIVVTIYLTVMTYIEFVKENKIFTAIGKGIMNSGEKIKKTWFPIMIIFIGFMIIAFANVHTYITIGLDIIYLAWARTYFVGVIE